MHTGRGQGSVLPPSLYSCHRIPDVLNIVCVCVCVYVYRGRSPEGVREIFGPAQKKRLFQKLAEKETPGHPGKVVEIRPNNRIF